MVSQEALAVALMVLEWVKQLSVGKKMASSSSSTSSARAVVGGPPRRTRRQKDAASNPAPMANGEAEQGDPRVTYQLPDLELKSTLGKLVFSP